MVFDAIDTGKNGQINYTEFLVAASRSEMLCCTKNLEAAFKNF